MKKSILACVLFGFVALSAHADSFSIKEETKTSMPTQADVYDACMKLNTYSYLPQPGEKQSSVDKKRAALKARNEKICQCSAPREYKLMKEVVGNDLDAFTARVQADRNFATAASKKLADGKRKIDKVCSK